MMLSMMRVVASRPGMKTGFGLVTYCMTWHHAAMCCIASACIAMASPRWMLAAHALARAWLGASTCACERALMGHSRLGESTRALLFCSRVLTRSDSHAQEHIHKAVQRTGMNVCTHESTRTREWPPKLS